MINICCVYYGNKYKPEYVQKLYNMVERNVTVPYEFYCFTDHVNLFDLVYGKIHFKTFPRYDMEGWWNKLQLFHPQTNLTGVNFYMDLDVVILKNIDCFLTWGNDLTFGILNDFGQVGGFNFNSSIMKWNNANMSEVIWNNYFKNITDLNKLPGDQNVISELVRSNENLKLFPDEWSYSYKWFSRKEARFSKHQWTFEKDPNALIAVFHGNPKPHESNQNWVKELWV
jgi:hypothetical protein